MQTYPDGSVMSNLFEMQGGVIKVRFRFKEDKTLVGQCLNG
jgi:hypothetical protein